MECNSQALTRLVSMEQNPQAAAHSPRVVDFLAEALALPARKRQQAFRYRTKCAKKYHHCRWCKKLLLRMNHGVKAFSPTDNAADAFCHDVDGECKDEFLKTTPMHRVVKLRGVPQPLDMSLLKTSGQWDELRDHAPSCRVTDHQKLRNSGASFRGSIGHGSHQPLIGPAQRMGHFGHHN
jgi:hypothetical protein